MLAILVTLAALVLVACSDDLVGPGGEVVISVPFEVVEDATGRTGFRLIGINGRVTVVGHPTGDGFTARGFRRVQGCDRARAEARIDELEVDVAVTATEILVRTIQPIDTGSCSLVVDYELIVPERLGGTLINVNGEIDVDDLSDGISITSVNGAVTVSDVEDDVTVRLTNGLITADLQPTDDDEVDLLTVNGSVDLTIPTTTDAVISLALANGTITVSNLDVTDEVSSSHSMTGVLGTGSGSIILRTTNGSLTLRGI